MSTWPISSILDARTQAFPVLTAAQIGRIRADSKLRKVAQGEILFKPGDTEVPFFVLVWKHGDCAAGPGRRARNRKTRPRRVHRRDDDDFRAALPGAWPRHRGR